MQLLIQAQSAGLGMFLLPLLPDCTPTFTSADKDTCLLIGNQLKKSETFLSSTSTQFVYPGASFILPHTGASLHAIVLTPNPH